MPIVVIEAGGRAAGEPGPRDRQDYERDKSRKQSRASRVEGVGGRGGPSHRSRREPLGRHASASVPAACRVGDRPLPEGRVGPPDGIAEAPARPLAVPLRPVQRLDHRADDDRRGLQRLDGRLRGVLRAVPRPAVRRGHAGLHQPREDRADRGAGRHVPPGRRPADDGRRGAAARGRARRALPRPVHLRRARDGLARQQQHRRVDLRPDGAGAASGSRLGRRGGRNRRDERDDRPLPALRALPHAAVRRRPGGLDLLLELDGRPVGVHRPAVAHRGHRPPAARAVVPPGASSTG